MTTSAPQPQRPYQYLADAMNITHPWLNQTAAWFAQHPEREFRLTHIPIAAVQAIGIAGWVAGVASCAPSDAPTLDIAVGQATVPGIVRRPDISGDRPLPGVYLLDGGDLPPLPKRADASRTAEGLAEMMWGLAQLANAMGVSLRSLPLAPPSAA